MKTLLFETRDPADITSASSGSLGFAAELMEEVAYLKASLKVARWELDVEQQRNNKLFAKTRAQKQELRRLNAVLRRTSLERQLREAKQNTTS